MATLAVERLPCTHTHTHSLTVQAALCIHTSLFMHHVPYRHLSRRSRISSLALAVDAVDDAGSIYVNVLNPFIE